MKTTLSFPEQYRELKGDMALPDWQIARKLGLRLEALERKLRRYKLPVSRALSEMVDDERVRRRELKAAS
ncbi:hypothetical protein ACNUDN_30565 [Mycobacterium sp. smrl_JER01]|uniref:hypothetical protein n=1 Tax=Mycobacterium sp. smrl_JER01 TaxID=3402633 RepID=UPI003AD56A50